jgi:hypothetical protein
MIKPFRKHQDLLAWDTWIDSDEGSRCAKPCDFTTPDMGRYLVNRLRRAFEAGIRYGRMNRTDTGHAICDEKGHAKDPQ